MIFSGAIKSSAKFLRVQSALPRSESLLWLLYVFFFAQVSRRSWGRNAWRTPKNVCVGGYPPATFLKFWMPPTFVTLFGTIWLPNHKELCDTKLGDKQARPSVTINSRTKQLFIESYSGSRQSMLQLLQTWETNFSNKRPFSGNKKLCTSREVKEFPKMLQRSNSVRDKDHRISMLECTGNTSASWPLNRQISFTLSKTRILHSILHQYF